MTLSWQPIPIVGGSYSDDTRPFSCQDTVNYIPVMAEKEGARSGSMLRGLPGYTTFCASMQEAPVRGLHNVEGLLLAVTGDTLYRIAVDGLATAIGKIPGVRRVRMCHNQIAGGHEVMIPTGDGGYVYNTVTGVLAQITDDGFPGFKSADFVDGYIAGVDPSGRWWQHSDLNAAMEYNTLDRYDAESAPDRMVALIVSHREVMVLSKRSIQFFQNTGADVGTFANANGTEIEIGCAGTHAVARLDNTVYWLGHDGNVYRLEGHSPMRVSTGPIEQAISRCNMAEAFAFTFEDRGHKVFYLTLPDGHTWGYDVWTGEWHRRQSKGLTRWRLNDLVRWNGQWIGGDFTNGKLYQLDWAAQHEAGEELERRRVTGVLHDNQNSVRISGLELVIDTGVVGVPEPVPEPQVHALYVGYAEGVTVYELMWPPGYRRDDPIEVYLGDVLIGAIEFTSASTPTSGAWRPVSSDLHEIRGGRAVLAQGGWSMLCEVNDHFRLFEAGIAQTYPPDTYLSTGYDQLGPADNVRIDGLLNIVMDGVPYQIKREVLDYTSTIIFPENFPVGVEKVISIDGAAADPSATYILVSYYHSPLIKSYGGYFNSHEVSLGFNGFRGDDNHSFTLERDGVSYTTVRGDGPNFTHRITPPPPAYSPNSSSLWLMSWSGGSCYVVWGSY